MLLFAQLKLPQIYIITQKDRCAKYSGLSSVKIVCDLRLDDRGVFETLEGEVDPALVG